MRVLGLFATCTVLLVGLFGFADTARSDVPALKKVVVFGDSLAHEAMIARGSNFLPADRFTVTDRTRSGQSPCWWTGKLKTDPLGFVPDIVVIETLGNNRSACQKLNKADPKKPDFWPKYSTQYYKMYRAHLSELIDQFPTTTTVYLETAPLISSASSRSNKSKMTATMNLVAKNSKNPSVRVYDAGRAVEKNGSFSKTLACVPEFPCMNRTVNSKTGQLQYRKGYSVVRAPDGIHFCPNLPALDNEDNPISGNPVSTLDNCTVLSVGAIMFGAAMAQPILSDFPDSANNQAAIETIRNAETALGSYYTQNDNFAASKTALKVSMESATTGEGALKWSTTAGDMVKSGNSNLPDTVIIEEHQPGRFGGVVICVGSKGTKNYCTVMFGNAPTQRYTLTGDDNVTGVLSSAAFTSVAQTASAGELLQGSPSTPASFLKPAGTGTAASTALWTAGLSS